MAANATFALKPGVWFLRVRFVIFLLLICDENPRRRQARKSTQPTVQILEASSVDLVRFGKSKYLTIESIDRLIARGGAIY